MNSPDLYAKVTSDASQMAALAEAEENVEKMIETLYLSIYSRYPTPEERQVASKLFERQDVTQRQTIEDLTWAMMNTPEFFVKD